MMHLPPLQQIQWIGVDLYSPTCPSHTYVLSSLSLDTLLVSLIGMLLCPLCIHCHLYQYSYRHTHKHAYSPPVSLTVSCRALCRQCVHFLSLEWQGDIACHISIPWQSPFLLRVIISFGVKGSICYKRTRAAGTEREGGGGRAVSWLFGVLWTGCSHWGVEMDFWVRAGSSARWRQKSFRPMAPVPAHITSALSDTGLWQGPRGECESRVRF